MSGVIDENGVQWEHCGVCGEFVDIRTLSYEQPSERFKYGRDIGPCCVNLTPEQQDAISERATRRKTVESMLKYTIEGQSVTLHKDGSIGFGPLTDEEKRVRWIEEDHGNGITSTKVHPDDAHIMKAQMDRTMAAYRAAREAVDRMSDAEVEVHYRRYMRAAV